MILDGRTMPPDARLEVDLCIIGAGPAGLSLAREFADSTVRVVVLESGGLDREPEIDRLGAGDSVGYPYHALERVRARGIGGSSLRWDEHQNGDDEAGTRAHWSRLTSSRGPGGPCPAGRSAITTWSRTTGVHRWSLASDHSPTTQQRGSETGRNDYRWVRASIRSCCSVDHSPSPTMPARWLPPAISRSFTTPRSLGWQPRRAAVASSKPSHDRAQTRGSRWGPGCSSLRLAVSRTLGFCCSRTKPGRADLAMETASSVAISWSV